MDYSEEDVIKLLKIQALTLKKIQELSNEMSLEVGRHRNFIKQILLEIKQAQDPDEQKEEILENAELPSNVLRFPVEQE